MSISRQNLSIVIVTFKSNDVIHDCIKSIDEEIQIIIVDNSNDIDFKKKIENTYKNVKCILSSENLGMGRGNNLGIQSSSTDFVLILNPDVILEKNSINELINASKKFLNFSVLAPISSDPKYPNYKHLNNIKQSNEKDSPFKVKSVDGFAMLINKKKINQIFDSENYKKEFHYFDENFFMYLENDDLCKRIIDKKGEIYVVPTSKINHLGAKAVDHKYKNEIEFSRNWHWVWSKFYFQKKHFSYPRAFIFGLPKFFSSILKYLLYFIINNTNKKKIYLNRSLGFYNAAIGKKSWYRPNINF
mgnify:FL=1